MKYGNGTETRYTYSPNRRRLATLSVTSPAYEGEIMSNVYRYDEMDNITSLVNDVTAKAIGNTGRTIGGRTSHSYDYDKWSRLIGAEGSFRASNTDTAHYNLSMSYDKLYNVTSKKLDLIQENLQFKGRLESGHEFTYTYDEENTFKLLNVNAKEYSSDSAVTDTFRSVHLYDFDANGNQIVAAVNPSNDSTCVSDTAGQKVRHMLWDEENRLLAINDNGFVSNYFYDASGERTVKLSAPDLAVYVNSEKALENDSALMKFVGYVSPYLVVTNGGRYTKHIYAGSQRIASKMGDIDAFGADPRRVEYAGADIHEIDFAGKYGKQNGALMARYDSFNVENKPMENNDYVDGKSFCCGGTPLSELSDDNTGEGESADYEGDIRLYHVDHLGSTTLVTDAEGLISQHVAYIPYGEVFVEQRNGSWNTPYLFNAKELDEETGLYYYGARYLDPTHAAWLSVDPLFEKYVGMTPYNYCAGNPVKLVDPNGEWPGVTMFFGEAEAGFGMGAALNVAVQKGIAFDDAGCTHFTTYSVAYVVNQGLETEGRMPQLLIGASASVTGGVKQNWSYNTFVDMMNADCKDGTIAPPLCLPKNFKVAFGETLSISAGADELGIGFGWGIGIKIHNLNSNVLQSISVSDSELSKLGQNPFSVWSISGETQRNTRKDGTTYFSNIAKIGIQTIRVTCDAVKDDAGNYVPSNIWMTDEYRKQTETANY